MFGCESRGKLVGRRRVVTVLSIGATGKGSSGPGSRGGNRVQYYIISTGIKGDR